MVLRISLPSKRPGTLRKKSLIYSVVKWAKSLFAECPTVMFVFRGMSMFTVYAHDEPLCVTLQWITRDTTFHVLTDETAIWWQLHWSLEIVIYSSSSRFSLLIFFVHHLSVYQSDIEKKHEMKGTKAVLKHLIKHIPSRRGCSNLKEKALQDHLVNNPPSPYKHLAAREWFVVPGRSDKGKGDLVFSHGNNYLVVETKTLPTATGHTARARRSKGRREVREQAERYSREWKGKYPSARVEAATYTNIDGLQMLESLANSPNMKCMLAR